MSRCLALLLLSLLSTDGFLVGRGLVGGRRGGFSSLLRCEPSDVESSESDGVSFTSSSGGSGDSSAYSQYNAPKEFLLDGSSALSRAEINEYVLALEKVNPTPEPASSRLLNGVWEVKSTGFGSPGLVGLQVLKAISSELVDSVTVTISSVAPRVVAQTTLKISSARVDVAVTTDLEGLGPTRLRETVSSIKIGTLDVPLSSVAASVPILTSRDLFVTYLDEDLLVARDSLGTPEILTRKFPKVRDSSGGSPSASGDDGAPGA